MARFAEGTTVRTDKTRAEIERTLARFGASHFAYMAHPDKAVIAFRTRDRNIRFDLPLKRAAHFRTVERHERYLREQWRALLLSIKAKLSSVESGIETFEQAFMAHVVMPDGRTISERIVPAIAHAYQTGGDVPLLPGPTKEG